MPMTFTTCISAQDFGLASETMIPGFQASQLSCAAPAQIVRVDPCHVFDESFLQDLVLWWTWPDTRIPLYIAGVKQHDAKAKLFTNKEKIIVAVVIALGIAGAVYSVLQFGHF